MKSILIVVGKTTNKHFIASIADYCSRIHHYMPFELLVIPELKNTCKGCGNYFMNPRNKSIKGLDVQFGRLLEDIIIDFFYGNSQYF